MTLVRIKIDCDMAGKTVEDALKKLGKILAQGGRPKAAYSFQVDEYDMAKCYVCNKEFRKDIMLSLGNDTYRCHSHNKPTIIKKGKELLSKKKRGAPG